MQSLRQELEEQSQNAPITALPDLYAIRDRVLKGWKVAKRGESKERLREFADRLIEELIASDTGYTMLNRLLSDLEQEQNFSRGGSETARAWESRYRQAQAELKRRGVNWES